ncbi:hypothetical protein PIB30_045862, partial [Stylosanthes scabra]|nr:hypothetical protein [Stylosanthes scabra]
MDNEYQALHKCQIWTLVEPPPNTTIKLWHCQHAKEDDACVVSRGSPCVASLENKRNPGRQFWECSHYEVQKGCKFFCWADAEQQEEDPKKEKLRKKVLSLKSMLKEIEWK